MRHINTLTAGPDYSTFLHFLLGRYVSALKHGKYHVTTISKI